MTNTMHNAFHFTRVGEPGSAQYRPQGEPATSESGDEGDHEYLSMDVYIDPRTGKGDCQGSLDPTGSCEYLPMDVYIDPRTMH